MRRQAGHTWSESGRVESWGENGLLAGAVLLFPIACVLLLGLLTVKQGNASTVEAQGVRPGDVL